ncbi:PRC-barrel domain-containing protein [Reyranella sp.]|uniref:PRC-barrel domain-containing protein n=1 Tax=Reyranella sp. TaxID=1929291 RepID=UPI003784D306
MVKKLLIVALLSSGAAVAYAQSPPQQAASPPSATASMPQDAAASADTRKLIGRNVKNANNDTIGEIKSIHIGPTGKVDSVIVGVGGFLGVGEREVSLKWSDLTISNDGESVKVNMTKDQLAAMPPYKYRDETWRGQVFTDKGPWTAEPTRSTAADRTAPGAGADTRASARDQAATVKGDFNADGNTSGSAIIGASIRNQAKETVGKINDIFIDKSGAIKTVVVSVGGFLGVGAKDVAVKWEDIHFQRDGNSVVLVTDWTKDSLKTMPEYKKESRLAR